MTRTCTSCPAPIGEKNKSGHCRSCGVARLNADPEFQARRRAGIAAKFTDPAYRAAHIERMKAMGESLSEEARERRRVAGRRNADVLRANSRALSPEIRAENGRKRSATALAWCPPEWRARYKELTTRGRRAPEAKRIILDLIAGRPGPVLYAQQKAVLAWCPPARKDEYRKLAKSLGAAEARRIVEASLTQFERMMARVAGGARLIDKPDLRPTGPAYSLVGNATALCG